MQDFHQCPYCAEDLEQWSVRFYRTDAGVASEPPARWREEGMGPHGGAPRADDAGDGLTLLSLCPSERCGYYVLRYRNGLSHWDRDVEAARFWRMVSSQ